MNPNIVSGSLVRVKDVTTLPLGLLAEEMYLTARKETGAVGRVVRTASTTGSQMDVVWVHHDLPPNGIPAAYFEFEIELIASPV